jgi:hypothetical protein
MNKFKINLASFIIALVFITGVSQPASAGMLGTQSLLPHSLSQQDQQQARHQIEQQLVELGVEADMAKSRIASLSDQQVADITNKLNELPAGADVGGVILTVFIVFVITDVIGATDIFPFIHPVNK